MLRNFTAMNHLILLGDSIFDNGRYINGSPDVSQQLQSLISAEWQITSLAIDGAITDSVLLQMKLLPADATHIVLSVGGNDALSSKALLHQSVRTVSEALLLLSSRLNVFEFAYKQVIKQIKDRNLPLLVCAIYNANFDDPDEQQVVKTAVALYNDVIIRIANDFGVPVLDLRNICNTFEDYANYIEPSVIGGYKIATAIAKHFDNAQSSVIARCMPKTHVSTLVTKDVFQMVVIADDDDRVGFLEPEHDVDFLICLGDLYDVSIKKAIDVYAPEYVLAVHGNHDFDKPFPQPCITLHNQIIELMGIRFGGFSGSLKYKTRGFHMFDQVDVEQAMSEFNEVDIFIAHNSPYGYHERDQDKHKGFTGFLNYIDRTQPRYFLHGHQHNNKCSLRNTTLIQGVYGERLISFSI